MDQVGFAGVACDDVFGDSPRGNGGRKCSVDWTPVSIMLRKSKLQYPPTVRDKPCGRVFRSDFCSGCLWAEISGCAWNDWSQPAVLLSESRNVRYQN